MSSSKPTAEASNLRRILLILTMAAAGMAALLSLLPAAGHDQLWFLLMSHRWLAGAQLYGPEAFDSNPPAIVWLSALPILLGRLLHTEATFAAKLLVILAETAAALLSYRLLTYATPTPADAPPVQVARFGDDRVARGFSLGSHRSLDKEGVSTPVASRTTLLFLIFAAIVIFYIVPARDFGQREHILSFLVLPYILAAAGNAVPRHLRILSGILAGLGICLKLQQALIPIAIELILLLTSRRAARNSPQLATKNQQPRTNSLLRPEPTLIVLIGVLYLATIHEITPLYFTAALPILRDTYWAVGHLNPLQLSYEAIELLILAAITITLYLRSPHRSPATKLLIVAGCASTLAYFLQGTGWYYQQLPAISFFAAALTLQLLPYAANIHLPNWTVPATATLSVLALPLTTHFTNYPFTADRAFAIDTPDPAFFRDLPAGTPIATLTTSVDATMMPVERYHLVWAQRTTALWLLPAILRSEASPQAHLTPLRLAHLSGLQHQWMLEDLNRWHPQLILVHRCEDPAVTCQLLEDLDARHDNLLAFFLRDPAFAALWSHYKYTRSLGPFDAYTLNP